MTNLSHIIVISSSYTLGNNGLCSTTTVQLCVCVYTDHEVYTTIPRGDWFNANYFIFIAVYLSVLVRERGREGGRESGGREGKKGGERRRR